ncbi:MAG TPA: hypothetical protein VGF39_03800 [Stellaceae bacterium]
MADLQGATAVVGTIEERKDLGTTPNAVWQFWNSQLSLAEREDEDFIKRGRRIVDRYRDERDANEARTAKYNILWSNIETLKPVLYGRTPEPDVARRHKDENDPVAAMGAQILEAALDYEQDIEEFDAVMQQVVEDRLLPGRGVARVFYEPEFGPPEEDPDGEPDEDGNPSTFEPVANERAPIRYVFWEDYRETPARTEGEIWWKAYRSFMTRDELCERFGNELGKKVGLDYTPSGVHAVASEANQGPLADMFKKATVWEIWDKKKHQAVWVAKNYSEGPLDTQDDPLELPDFFPSPPCLRATTTNNKRVAVADYIEYQDQAQELDVITSRIDKLTRALKVAGVYAGSEKMVLQQLVDDSSENRLIPVEDWAGFAGDKGGLQNLIQWLPVEQIARVMIQLYDARERLLQIIYQTTGIADILRGETNPIETLGAQQLKTQFATRRITRAQKDVGRFARDLMRLRGAVMARHFDPETLSRMSGLPQPLPALPPPPPMFIPAPTPAPGPAMGGGPALPAPAPAPAAGPPPSRPGILSTGGPGMPGGAGAPPGAGLPAPAVGVPGRPGPMISQVPPGAVRAPMLAPPGPPLPPGARLARDGRHYVPDPRRPGKYLMVA